MALINPLDAAWLQVESYESPMHVGCLQVFAPPPHAGADYVRKRVGELRRPGRLAPPFSLKLKPSRLQAVLPEWTEEPRPDMDYHVRHSALAERGEAGLDELVASLYGVAMDRSRPLWECHVIEGLERGRFALFTKIHHSLMDGIGGMRLLQSMLSPDAHCRSLPAPWARHGQAVAARVKRPRSRGLARWIAKGAKLARDLYPAFAAHWDAFRGSEGHGLVAPYSAPRSVLNGPVARHRAFATQRIPLERVHAVAQANGVTINDVFLALCAGALRHDLDEAGELPGWPLIAGVPVSVRPEHDASVGTAISFLLANLATDVASPHHRLMEIHRSTLAGKRHLTRIGAAALAPYTLLMMAPHMLQLMTGFNGVTPPVFNLAISNVPGPAEPLYFNGARLEAIYPMSVLTHGQALNITTVSYTGAMHVGLTAGHTAAHRLERLAGNLLDELKLLESGRRTHVASALHRAAA